MKINCLYGLNGFPLKSPDKHLKMTGGYNSWNIVNIITKMKILVWMHWLIINVVLSIWLEFAIEKNCWENIHCNFWSFYLLFFCSWLVISLDQISQYLSNIPIYLVVISFLFSKWFMQCMYLAKPTTTIRMWHKINFFKQNKIVWIQFSFSETSYLNKAREPSLHYYLSKVQMKIDRFIPFTRAFTHIYPGFELCSLSISYEDNCWT